MKEGIDFDKLSLEELEKLHLEVHALFSKTLRGEAKEWSFRKLFVLHKEISAALIRTGGKHIAPVDQLDNLEIYEEGGERSMIAKVIAVHKVAKTAKTFYYHCTIENNTFVGKTFNTSIAAKAGEKLEVVFVDLKQYTDPETKKIWFSWLSPLVIGKSQKSVTSIESAKKIVEETSGKIAEKKLPKIKREELSEVLVLDKGVEKRMEIRKSILKTEQLDKVILKSKITFEKESEIIKENKKKPEASKKHKFKPAVWTHPNGHPRCLICGDEEMIGGICNNPNPPDAKTELEQSKTRFKLKHDWWKKQFVIKDLPVEHWSVKFKTKAWQYFTLNKNPLTVETGITGIKKKGNQTLYDLKGIIPPGRNLNPNKKISMHIDDLDDGIVDIIKDSENEMHVNFSGKKLKGIWIFKRSDPGSDVWSVSKGELPAKVKILSREFGAPLSDEEIHDLYFLSENKVGVSEIGRLLERPNSTIYEWKEKLNL